MTTQKKKIQRIFLIANLSNEFKEFSNGTTHDSLRLIYQSAKIDRTKKHI